MRFPKHAFKFMGLAALLASTPALATDLTPGPAAAIKAPATITAGNTFQTVLTAAQRYGLTVQNNNATDNCWIHLGVDSATKANSMLLLPGESYTRYFPYVPNDAVQATCASTSDTLYVDYN